MLRCSLVVGANTFGKHMRICNQCGFESDCFTEGVCEECFKDNQCRLDQWNFEFQHWNSLSESEKEDRIKSAL